MSDKREIRKKYKAIRNRMSSEEVREQSERICDHIKRHPLFIEAEYLYVYYPLGNEVDLCPLIREAWKMGKRVAFPTVNGDDMDFYEVSDFGQLQAGTFGVMEPEPIKPVYWKNPLMLVPGVAFDQNGNRMGYGKGYYDRYLTTHPNCTAMAVAYACQVTEHLPVDDYDRPLSYLATEQGVVGVGQSEDLTYSMDFEQAMLFLEETKQYGSQLGLDSICHLMEELDNVQDKIPVVHIGGTNGKGSVGAMLSSVLVEAGYRVGRFNTPDVFCYEEEFLENGKPIRKDRLAKLYTKVAAACKRLTEKGLPHPTRFEVETAAAFLWFFEEAFDVALVEVGMGGETDATNLIHTPLLSVLTSISMDHMRFLGNSISEITTVKAGIIKEHCPVVTMPQTAEAIQVIKERCAQKQAELYETDMDSLENIRNDESETGFDVSLDCGRYHVSLGIQGSFQIENASCVLTALRLLKKDFPAITDQSIVRGLSNVQWKGRFERIGTDPDFYLDGAHNEDAVRKLRDTLDRKYPGKKIVFIMAVLADKEYQRMIQIMFRQEDTVYTLTPPNPRALCAKELAELLRGQNVNALSCENASYAVSYAVDTAKKEQAIVVAFGSLYNLACVRDAYTQMMLGDNGTKTDIQI